MARLRKLSRFQPSNWMNTPLLSRLLCLVSKPKLILLLSLQFVVCIGGKGSWEKKNSERNWICYGSGYNVHINKRLNNSFLNGSVLLCFWGKRDWKRSYYLDSLYRSDDSQRHFAFIYYKKWMHKNVKKKAKYIFISQECYIILLPFICK